MDFPSLQADIDLIARIEAVPRILEVVCRTTGMRFAAVARVTEERWVCCSVRDEIDFGLTPGSELQIATTICDEIRRSGQPVVIDHVAQDAAFCGHPTPAMYGFQSYISMPIVLADGSFFGTLCAIDPEPARLKESGTADMFRLFAEQIAFYIDAQKVLRTREQDLAGAREAALLREQFMAVLGHDLRNPLQSLQMAVSILAKAPVRAPTMVPVMHKSIRRMAELVDNLMDLAQSRLGGGLQVTTAAVDISSDLEHVVQECRGAWPGRAIDYTCSLDGPVVADRRRLSQLLSNLVGNALKHGSAEQPVSVQATGDAQGFTLSVANGGPPIPGPVRQRLFEPSVRGSSQPNTEGLGLGLYIVSEIARSHGGRVDVASDERETRFTFRMPAAT